MSRLRVSVSVVFALTMGCPHGAHPTGDAGRHPHGSHGDAGVAAVAPGGDAGVPDPCVGMTDVQRTAVVAHVGDERLTLCDFAHRMNLQNPYLRARFAAPEARRSMLQSWVDAELLAAEAHARGLDEDPEVRRAITMRLARSLEMEVRSGATQPAVSDDDVRAYFEAHRSEYETDAQVRASQVVLATRAEAERVLQEARNHAPDDAYFRALVRRSSIDVPSRQADGDLAFFPRTGAAGVEPEVAAAAFELQNTGQFADHVIESAHGGPNHGPGFHIVRLTARREALHRTLEEESRRIRTRLQRDRRDQAETAALAAEVALLHRGANVQIDEAALAQVQVNTSAAPTSPSPVGGMTFDNSRAPLGMGTPPGLTTMDFHGRQVPVALPPPRSPSGAPR